MLSKQFRVPIQRVGHQRGRTQETSFFKIKTVPNECGHDRFGFVISKKVAARATKRNRLKRILFQAIGSITKVKQGYDVIVYVSPRAGTVDEKILLEDFKKIIKIV
ncbi:MAG: ribonuclease P protein component [bacterium]|nr:ribonuclease P protein component [bacterium]